MSTLIIDELIPGVVFEQPVTISKNLMVGHVRPWIYKHNTLQDGDFRLRVFDGATLLATSLIGYADINAAVTNNYSHGFMRFDFESLQLNIPETSSSKEYTFKFDMINHTLDSSNFIGMVRRFEEHVYTVYGSIDPNGDAVNDMVEPCGLEIYEYLGA